MEHRYEYPRPALTVDCVVFGIDESGLKVLLIERGVEPHRGSWALPGGFVHVDETLEDAARRELTEETGLRDVYLEQLYTFGALERDPRERVVSVAYSALVKLSEHQTRAATDAADAAWFSLPELPPLAFDHADILGVAVERLRSRVRYAPVGFELLPRKFTLRQLQDLYEVILEETIDKRNFRKKVLGMGLLVELDEFEQGVAHRAARFYEFDAGAYRELEKSGFQFRI